MQAQHQKCCYIKLWRIIKVSSISRAFNIICILFYCGLYTMAIDVVTWRIIKKWCVWCLHLRNFLWLPVNVLFLWKLCRLSRNYKIFIYIYLKLKLGTAKCICLQWVFLPQWVRIEFYIRSHLRSCQWLLRHYRRLQSPSALSLNVNFRILQKPCCSFKNCYSP